MKKNIFYAIIISIFSVLFATTCYREIPHIVVLHFGLPEDFYEAAGTKNLQGIYSLTVYPSQSLYQAIDGKSPEEWNWEGTDIDKRWTKTEYGDYGFETKNGDESLEKPYVYSFSWTDDIQFIVDHVQNRQTVGLYDEIYDIKDIYVPYKGPTPIIDVTYCFYQNEYSGEMNSDNVSEKKEIRITKKCLAGLPITDTPDTIFRLEDGEIVEYWKDSTPVTTYSRTKFEEPTLKDYGYLEYLDDDVNDDNGTYFSFVDNIYSTEGASMSTGGRYTFIVTDDNENEDYKGVTYISNDESYPLPRHNLIVRPVYTAPVENVTYFYYNLEKLTSRQNLIKTDVEYRVGKKLKSPQTFYDEALAVNEEPFWSYLQTTSTENNNFGYVDLTKTIRRNTVTVHPTMNFRAKFGEDLVQHYIFAETDDKAVILPNAKDIYSESRVYRSMNITPRYVESNKIGLIFDFGNNKDFNSYELQSITIVEDDRDDYMFDYRIGVSDLQSWVRSNPYSKDYQIGYGYRHYDANDSQSPGTLYYFNPDTENANDYKFKYKKLVNPTVWNENRYEDAVIKFGEKLDLSYYINNEEDTIVFVPYYTTKDVIVGFNHNTTVKDSQDSNEYDACEAEYSEITVVQGERFPKSDKPIGEWIFDEPTTEKSNLVDWKEDADLTNYGYVNTKNKGQADEEERWWDFKKTKEDDEDKATYKFKIVGGKDDGKIVTAEGYFLNDTVLEPIYEKSMADVVLRYYKTTGSNVDIDNPLKTETVERKISLQKGTKLDINLNKFSDTDYMWYDAKAENWQIDNDDFAKSVGKNAEGEYKVDFRNELKYGYRDANDHNKRYYFGDDSWYSSDFKKSFRFRNLTEGTEFVTYLGENAADSTKYKVRKNLLFEPKYINAGYAATPIYFRSPNATESSSVKMSNTTQRLKDDYISKYCTAFVYIPGISQAEYWPRTRKDNVISILVNDEYTKGTRPYGESSIGDYPIPDANGDEQYRNNAKIDNLLVSEIPVTKAFFAYLVCWYHNYAIGRCNNASMSYNDSSISGSKANILQSMRYYNENLSKFQNGSVSEASIKSLFPDIKPDVLNKKCLFIFHEKSLACNDNESLKGASNSLTGYNTPELGVRALGLCDSLTFCNLMTYAYNEIHGGTSGKLSYAYTQPVTGSGSEETKPFSGKFLASSGIETAAQSVMKGSDYLVVDGATGFRFLSYYEDEYVNKIILNELTLGVEETVTGDTGNNYLNKYTYRKNAFNRGNQNYFKRGVAHINEGLRNMNGSDLANRKKFRNSSSEFLTHSSMSGEPSHYVAKKDLNNRSGSNLFDQDGYLGSYFPEDYNNYGSGEILSTWRDEGNKGKYVFYTINQSKSDDQGLRVCRSVL